MSKGLLDSKLNVNDANSGALQSWNDKLISLATNPILLFLLSVISILLGIASIILTLVLYYKSLGKKRIFYILKSENILRPPLGAFPSIVAFYNGEPIDTLTTTYVVIWNAGNTVLRGDDLALIAPLAVYGKNTAIIKSAKIIAQAKQGNGFSLLPSQDNTYPEIRFNYMGRGDGVVLVLDHTGTSGYDLEVTGEVVEGELLSGNNALPRVNWSRRIIAALCLPLTWGFLGYIIAKFGLNVWLLVAPAVGAFTRWFLIRQRQCTPSLEYWQPAYDEVIYFDVAVIP